MSSTKRDPPAAETQQIPTAAPPRYASPMTPRFTLRALTPADAEAVAALVRQAFATQTVATDPPPSALRETPENIAAILAEGGGAAAIIDGHLAGALVWQEKAGGLYIGRLCVNDADRGHGIARALVAAAETEARRTGQPRLWLSTRLSLIDNRRLFAGCGFVEIAEHAHPGYSAPTFVDMEKRLA